MRKLQHPSSMIKDNLDNPDNGTAINNGQDEESKSNAKTKCIEVSGDVVISSDAKDSVLPNNYSKKAEEMLPQWDGSWDCSGKT